ncbi:tetratricopeptide repeat protein, partial [bacterium]|nr:tetratricopeptide repeat protein [bacterium]
MKLKIYYTIFFCIFTCLYKCAQANDFKTFFNEGRNSYYQNDCDQALYYFQKANALQPNSYQIHFNIGIIYTTLKKDYVKALKSFDAALKINPHYAKAYIQRAKIFLALKKYKYCLNDLEQASNLEKNNLQTLFDIAFTANIIGQTNKALEAYKKVLTILPNHTQTFYNIGYTLRIAGDLDNAIIYYQKALEQNPNYNAAQYALALALLNNGQFLQGWKEYQPYLKQKNINAENFRLWLRNGELVGKTILIKEQGGFGDTIQFIRFAFELKQLGASTITYVRKPMIPLLSLCPFLDQVIQKGDAVPIFDEVVTTMALPALLNCSQKELTKKMPYLFASPELIDYWQTIVHNDSINSGNQYKIGLCWTADKKNDESRPLVAHRSIELKQLECFSNVENINFYSLQKINPIIKNHLPNGPIITTFVDNFDTDHGAFMDTAALIKNLDLVITVDTSIAHLAG